MKVQIIHLDPQDDQDSVCDQLSWVQAPRTILVWPREGRILTRRLDLVLIQRQARRRAVQLGLVCFDPVVQAHARDLGLPVFDSLEKIPEEGWRRGQTRPWSIGSSRLEPPRRPTGPQSPVREEGGARWPTRLQRIVLASSVLPFLVLAALLLPSAQLSLTPQVERQSLSLRIRLDPSAEAAHDDRIPAQIVHVEVEGQEAGPTTGRRILPIGVARGVLRLTNLGRQPVTVPHETGVVAPGFPVRFVTTASIALAAGPGTTATVPIEATVPGLIGNVPAGAIRSLEGPLGHFLAVTNLEPTLGGGQESWQTVGIADQQRLQEKLTEALLMRAAPGMEASLSAGYLLLEDSLNVGRVLESVFDRQVGDPAWSLSLKLGLEITGFAYRDLDLREAAQRALDAALPTGRKTVPNTLVVELREAVWDEQAAAWVLDIQAGQRTYSPIDLAGLPRELRGRRPSEALEIVSDRLALSRPAALRLRPAWFPWLPFVEERLEFLYAWERRG